MIPPTVDQKGGVFRIGWQEGVHAIVDRFHEDAKYTVTAEVSLYMNLENTPEMNTGHIHQARVNLTSTPAKKTLARALEERMVGHAFVDWSALVEQLCVGVLRAYRQGEPVKQLKGKAPPSEYHYQLNPILPKSAPTILYGPGGLGKSYLAVYFALLIQSELPMTGLWPTQGNVLYLDYEDGDDELQQRVYAIKQGLGSIGEDVAIHYRYCHQVLASEIPEIQRLCAELDISMIVVDSLGGATAGMVNDSETNTRFFNAIRSMRVTCLIIDHVSKEGGDKGPIGSVFKYNRARSVWEMKKNQEEGDAFSKVALYHRKMNGGKIQKPLGYELQFEGDPANKVTITKIDPKKDVSLSQFASLPDKIEAVLDNGAMNTTDLAEEIGAKLDHVRVTLSRNRQRFIRLQDGTWGVLAKPGDDGP